MDGHPQWPGGTHFPPNLQREPQRNPSHPQQHSQQPGADIHQLWEAQVHYYQHPLLQSQHPEDLQYNPPHRQQHWSHSGPDSQQQQEAQFRVQEQQRALLQLHPQYLSQLQQQQHALQQQQQQQQHHLQPQHLAQIQQQQRPALEEPQHSIVPMYARHPYVGIPGQSNSYTHLPPIYYQPSQFYDQEVLQCSDALSSLQIREDSYEKLQEAYNLQNSELPYSSVSSDNALTVVEYIEKYGKLTRLLTLHYGEDVRVNNWKGSKMLSEAVRHVLDTYQAGFTWEGQFEEIDLKIRNGHFCIDFPLKKTALTLDSNLNNLFIDLNRLFELLKSHYQEKGSFSIFVKSLFLTVQTPPKSIYKSETVRERYLDFLRYHLACANQTNRSCLTRFLGDLPNYLIPFDLSKFEEALNNAHTEIYGGANTEQWTRTAVECPGTVLVFQGGDNNIKTGTALLQFNRHMEKHLPEKTLVTTPPPADIIKANTPPNHKRKKVYIKKSLCKTEQKIKDMDEVGYINGLKFGDFLCEAVLRIRTECFDLEQQDYIEKRWKQYIAFEEGTSLCTMEEAAEYDMANDPA